MAKKKSSAPLQDAVQESEKRYVTLRREASAEMTEKKSVFIGHACPVRTPEEAITFVSGIRARYPDATHNVYAYRIGANVTRYSDDGEPGGTAGMPVLEIIRKGGFTDAAIVVTRYFGGVLLGAGGLVRAYTKGAKDAVDAAQIKCMAEAARISVTVDYGLYGRLAQVFAEFDARIEDEQFADNVRIILCIRTENSQKLTDKLIDVCNGAVSIEELEKLNYDFA